MTSSHFNHPNTTQSYHRGNDGNVHYYGDYYAAPQLGGNRGGHGNHNTITGSVFIREPDPMQTRLDRIGGMIAFKAMSLSECCELIVELGKVREKIGKLEERRVELVEKVKLKLGDL